MLFSRNFFSTMLHTFLLATPLSMYADQEISVADPYLWLEGEDQKKTEWLAQQKVEANAYFDDPALKKLIGEHLQQLADIENIGIPQQIGDRYFFLMRKKGEAQASLYELKQGSLKTIIDSSQFSNTTTSLTNYVIQPERSLLLYGLSSSGSDWQEWRIKNLDTGIDLPDVLTRIKFDSPTWDKEGQGVFYFRYQEKQADELSDSQELYYHRLGTPSSEDKKFYASDKKKKQLFTSLALSDDGRYLLFDVGNGGSFNGVIYSDLKSNPDTFIELFPAVEGISYNYFGNVAGRLFFTSNDHAEKGKIISIDPSLPGAERIREHVAEGDGFMQDACFVEGRIVVSYLKDARSQLKIFSQEGKLHKEICLSRLCTAAISHKQAKPSNPQFFYAATDFVSPPTIYRADIETGNSEVFFTPQITWKPDDYQIKQVFYPSKDGTSIPMFLVSKKDTVIDGNTPVLLYGYGGFHIPVTPHFKAKYLAWIDFGGVFAIANIRGGSEYGETWHKAGMLANKQNVFDDFIAAGEWLCSNGYTNRSKLAISGTSNGGLLVGACLVQRPDLFKAAIVDVGVLDMLRFHLFTVGWAWTEEYGSPNNPEHFKTLLSYSPYHNVKAGTAYPSTLIVTADHDDRVVPIHSFKFAAALKGAHKGTQPILLRVYENTGHGAGKSYNQAVSEATDQLYFLMRELNVTNLNKNHQP